MCKKYMKIYENEISNLLLKKMCYNENKMLLNDVSKVVIVVTFFLRI